VTSTNLRTAAIYRSNRKTQPYYWLATDHNNNDQTKNYRKGKEKLISFIRIEKSPFS
jgi:hypothetical protein